MGVVTKKGTRMQQQQQSRLLRHIAIPGAILLAVLAVIVGPGYVRSSAQTGTPRADATPAFRQGGPADHPMIGSWILVDAADPGQPSAFAVFHADGTMVYTDANGASSYGVWVATDAVSVNFNLLGFELRSRSVRGNSGPQSVSGTVSLQGTAAVTQKGYTFEANAKVVTTELDGDSVTQPGTIDLQGTRIVVPRSGIGAQGTPAVVGSPAA